MGEISIASYKLRERKRKINSFSLGISLKEVEKTLSLARKDGYRKSATGKNGS